MLCLLWASGSKGICCCGCCFGCCCCCCCWGFGWGDFAGKEGEDWEVEEEDEVELEGEREEEEEEEEKFLLTIVICPPGLTLAEKSVSRSFNVGPN